MGREIAEQPAAVAATLDALRPLRSRLAGLGCTRKQVLFVARGSSDNAPVYGRYLLETHAGRLASMAAPRVATHYQRRLDLSESLVVSIEHPGQTQEIVETQSWAKACGAVTVAISNVEDSPLTQSADLALVTRAGPERAVQARKLSLAGVAIVWLFAGPFFQGKVGQAPGNVLYFAGAALSLAMALDLAQLSRER